MVVVKKCCYCCQLRTGVTVLGCIGAVLALFHLTAVSAIYANLHAIVGRINFDHNRRAADLVESAFESYLPIQITSALVSAVSCILLVWGASIGNRFMLLPWLVLEMMSIILLGLLVLIGIIMICFAVVGIFPGLIILVFGGLFLAIEVYIWMCVLSCFQELRDSQTPEEHTMKEMPKSLENIIVDYQPPPYEKLGSISKIA